MSIAAEQTDGEAAPPAPGGQRDVMVTGMGFCLPGVNRRVQTSADLWDIASRGQSSISRTEIDTYQAAVDVPEDEFHELFPDIPGVFSRHFNKVHRLGLASMAAACADAGLDYRAGELVPAAVLVGRGSMDAGISAYLEIAQADPATVTPSEALQLILGTELAVTPSDVAFAQSALAQSTGPCFTVCCGCASSAVQLGNAALLIESGAIDLAVVTGADVLSSTVIAKGVDLQYVLRRVDDVDPETGLKHFTPTLDKPMRPYDKRGGPLNFGEGSATLILESREHAERRGAACYGRILAHALTRDGGPHPLASDETGRGLAQAVRQCLGERWPLERVRYINGASDGNPEVTSLEVGAIRELYGLDGGAPLMTSQEACFGHMAAPAGNLGVALTLLMIAHGEVCPTANCEEPVDGLPFDPVIGGRTRPLDLDCGMVLTYQMGGVKSAILVGRPDFA